MLLYYIVLYYIITSCDAVCLTDFISYCKIFCLIFEANVYKTV